MCLSPKLEPFFILALSVKHIAVIPELWYVIFPVFSVQFKYIVSDREKMHLSINIKAKETLCPPY